MHFVQNFTSSSHIFVVLFLEDLFDHIIDPSVFSLLTIVQKLHLEIRKPVQTTKVLLYSLIFVIFILTNVFAFKAFIIRIGIGILVIDMWVYNVNLIYAQLMNRILVRFSFRLNLLILAVLFLFFLFILMHHYRLNLLILIVQFFFLLIILMHLKHRLYFFFLRVEYLIVIFYRARHKLSFEFFLFKVSYWNEFRNFNQVRLDQWFLWFKF